VSEPPSARTLAVERVTRRFAGDAGVSDVSFTVAPGELLALLGASGSGKTTTLRIIAGYEQPDSGRVLFGGADITALPPRRREFGMVFQHYALFPHMNVLDNVAFGLEARGVRRAERHARAQRALESVGLGPAGSRSVQSLSGGEQQRVALARVLAIDPRALLLDEPLSNLDPALRQQIRGELSVMLRRVEVPTVFVTHDQEDAFAIADRVALLRGGRILQIGTPEELYREPASLRVAQFIGRGRVVRATEDGDGAVVRIGGINVRVPVLRRVAATTPAVAAPANGDRFVLLRPEALRLTRAYESGAWTGTVKARRFAGSTTVVTVELADGVTVDLETQASATPGVGEPVGVAPTGVPVPMFGA
jgi:ABC-type Fe3+/spermidine/putrescine transport system ATPase subunit